MRLVAEWKLETDEIEAGENRIKNMIRIYRSGKWRKEEIQAHFNEWKNIALRLKKGGEMIDNTEALRVKSIEYKEKLEGLYKYLLRMLGMYDSLFKHMYKERPELYTRAQEAILQELK